MEECRPAITALTEKTVRERIRKLNLEGIADVVTELQYGGKSLLVRIYVEDQRVNVIDQILDAASRAMKDIISPIQKNYAWVMVGMRQEEVLSSLTSDIAP